MEWWVATDCALLSRSKPKRRGILGPKKQIIELIQRSLLYAFYKDFSRSGSTGQAPADRKDYRAGLAHIYCALYALIIQVRLIPRVAIWIGANVKTLRSWSGAHAR